MKHLQWICATLCALTSPLLAHDSWLQTNTNIIRAGDAVHIDLMLGNHGNGHRDFKLAGKLDVAPATLKVLSPGGQEFDLKPRLKDLGYTPEEGFWSTKFVASRPGLYTVAHTFDSVASYAPVRNIKSAKTCFVASKSMDRVPIKNPGFERRLGHALELIGARHQSRHADGAGYADGCAFVFQRQTTGENQSRVYSARRHAPKRL